MTACSARPAAGRVAAVVAGLALGAALLPGPAAAHVRLEEAVPGGDGTTTLVLAFEHGCDGAGTVGLDLLAAPGVTYLDVTVPREDWVVQVQPTAVRWDGPAVPDGEAVELRVRAEVTGTPGETVRLPIVQRCEADQAYAWVDADPASETPAPTLVLTESVLRAPTPPSGATWHEALLAVAGTASFLAAAAVALCVVLPLGRPARGPVTSVPSAGPPGRRATTPRPAPPPRPRGARSPPR